MSQESNTTQTQTAAKMVRPAAKPGSIAATLRRMEAASSPESTTPMRELEHEHYTISTSFGRKQAIWSTKDECVKCGTGRPYGER